MIPKADAFYIFVFLKQKMGFFKFIFSKTFLLQLVLAAVVVVIISFAMLQWLDYSTNHGQEIAVPDLSGLKLEEAEDVLNELALRAEILDSSNYNPDFPPHAIIEQVPDPGSSVKENRKIYLTLNPSGYRMVEIPKGLIRRTRREVEPTLRSIGFKIGEITYKPDIAKDVLALKHKGETLEPGDKLKETSVIDLVVGDGKGSFEDPDAEENPEEITAEEMNFLKNQ